MYDFHARNGITPKRGHGRHDADGAVIRWCFADPALAPLRSQVSSRQNIETGEPLKSCTMIVTNANELAAKIHDRMPVLLAPNEFEPWLSEQAGTEILNRAPELMLQVWPVSRRVNSSRAPGDDPTLINQVAA